MSLLWLQASHSSEILYVNSFDSVAQSSVIRAYDAATGNVINSFAAVGGAPTGMAVGGGFLYQGSVAAYRV